jgi:hypothetical protein
MVSLRSARLEAIFGKRIEDLTAADVHALADNQVAESFDLDFKEELYGRTDSDKRSLAGDIAALANTAGGVIILGVAEDDQARASDALGVPVSDDEVRRIITTAGGNLMPVPKYDVLAWEDKPGSAHGFIVIAVPRSPGAPHAVLVNQSLRYPKRNGSTTRYLSEPEVADAYRHRFATGHQLLDRTAQLQHDAEGHLDPERTWISTVVVPELPGEFVIDQQTWRRYNQDMVGTDPMLLQRGVTWQRLRVGQRRLIADGEGGASPLATWLSAELHDDGAGSFAVELPDRIGRYGAISEDIMRMVADEDVVNAVLSTIQFLARHARDVAAAGGNAMVTIALSSGIPVALGHNRASSSRLGTQDLKSLPTPNQRMFPLESLAAEGPELVTAAYILASDVFQAFGFIEALQVTREGCIRINYWKQEVQSAVRSWAERAGVEVTDETV